MLKKHIRTNSLITLLFVLSLLVQPAFSKDVKQDYFDGPYITWIDNLTIVCITVERVNGKKKIKKKVLAAKDFPEYSKTLPMHELTYSLIEPRLEESEYKASRIIAIGDIHGNFRNFKLLLINNKIVDKQLNWINGSTHLVLPGDVLDRGSKSTECIWLIRKLEVQAAKAGGKVHFLLGNHEYMVSQGDLRYLDKKYSKLHRYRYDRLFSPTTEFGKWLRTKNVVEKINGYIFSHAGISPKLAKTGLSLKKINHLFRELIDIDFVYNEPDKKKEKLFKILQKGNGPVWYRGYYKNKKPTQKKFNSILTRYKAKKIIVGHTKQKTITSYFNGKLIAIDVMDYNIPSKISGEALLIEKGVFYRMTIEGKKERLNFDDQ